MTGIFLAMPAARAVDASGMPVAGALLQFYLTGTTTPASIYASAGLATPLANPVAADAGGLFAPIFLDPSVSYRAQLQTAGGTVIRDIDPVFAPVTAPANSIAAGMLQAGVAAANLGFLPLNRAGDTATNLLIANSVLATTSAGYLGLPLNQQDGSYTCVLSDAGKMVRANVASAIAYIIPKDVYPAGTAIVFRNAGAGVVTLTPAAGVIFYKTGTVASVSSIALAQSGLCTAIGEATNTWVFSGAGMT